MNNRHTEIRMVAHLLLMGKSTHKGKILVMRRWNRKNDNGMYQVPTVRVKKGEFPIPSLACMMWKDFNIDLVETGVQLVHLVLRDCMHEPGKRQDLYFTASAWEGRLANLAPDKCDDIRWVPSHELPDTTVRHMKDDIRAYHAKIFYKEIQTSWSLEHASGIRESRGGNL